MRKLENKVRIIGFAIVSPLWIFAMIELISNI